MAASGSPSRTSSVYTPRTTRTVGSQRSLDSALTSASEAYDTNLPADSPEAESRQPRDEGGISVGQKDGKSSKRPRNKARKRGVGSRSVMNGDKTARRGAVSGDHSDGEMEGPSSPSSRVDYSSSPADDFFEGDATEPFGVSELELIEDALKSLRGQSWRQPVTDHEQGSEKFENPEQSPSPPNHQQDVDGVARLLKKVQTVRTQKTEALSKHRKSRPGTKQRSLAGGEGLNTADIRQVVQAASQAALAAAKAAETAASLVDKNSQAIEHLYKTLLGSGFLQLPANEDTTDDVKELEEAEKESSGDRILDIELRQTKISNKLVRQNKITHVVLGVMIVTTIIWRFVVVKFVKKVSNKIQNPFEGITDMFDGFTGGADQERSQKDQRGGLGLKFPQLMGNSDDEGESKSQKSHKPHKPHDKGDVFSKIGSILPGQ